MEQQERQYQDGQHQQQIVSELLDKIQKLETEITELQMGAVDGGPCEDAKTQTELDVDQLAVELQLAQQEIEEKTNYIQELEAQLSNNVQVEQLKNALEIPHDLEQNANAVVESVTGYSNEVGVSDNSTQEDAETETTDPVPESAPNSNNTTPRTKKSPKKTVHDKLYQQAFEPHCAACEQAAQGLEPNVPHVSHIPSPRSRSLSASRNLKSNTKAPPTTNASKKPVKTTTSKYCILLMLLTI